jgi:dephospho-CoA kinase
MAFLIGLTGGIGSGKSTVAELFRNFGATIIDTDEISHRLTAPDGRALPEITAQFGRDFLDPRGALDRGAMRDLVFRDPSARERLEAILHPLIAREVSAAVAATTGGYTIIVVPLLFEKMNYRDLVRRTLTVDCSEDTQVARAGERSAIRAEILRSIVRAQVPRAIRLQLADDVICNEGDRSALAAPVQRLHNLYNRLCAADHAGSGKEL